MGAIPEVGELVEKGDVDGALVVGLAGTEGLYVPGEGVQAGTVPG